MATPLSQEELSATRHVKRCVQAEYYGARGHTKTASAIRAYSGAVEKTESAGWKADQALNEYAALKSSGNCSASELAAAARKVNQAIHDSETAYAAQVKASSASRSAQRMANAEESMRTVGAALSPIGKGAATGAGVGLPVPAPFAAPVGAATGAVLAIPAAKQAVQDVREKRNADAQAAVRRVKEQFSSVASEET